MARFAPSNEHGDWETAHHVFTYANAVHQALKRLPPAVGRRREVLRAVFHGAMAVYLARYLNVPPARLPGEDSEDGLDDLPSQPMALQAALLDSFDRRHQVELAARLVARHLRLGHPPDLLITTLATAVLREDAGFHAYQMLEAGVRQFHEWGDTDEGRHVLIAVARYLAAHFPTERASLPDRRNRPPAAARRSAARGCRRRTVRVGRGYGRAARSSGGAGGGRSGTQPGGRLISPPSSSSTDPSISRSSRGRRGGVLMTIGSAGGRPGGLGSGPGIASTAGSLAESVPAPCPSAHPPPFEDNDPLPHPLPGRHRI